eukprot:scaffold79224_cov17-Tisochrysis_lutea.AAC.1
MPWRPPLALAKRSSSSAEGKGCFASTCAGTGHEASILRSMTMSRGRALCQYLQSLGAYMFQLLSDHVSSSLISTSLCYIYRTSLTVPACVTQQQQFRKGRSHQRLPCC